MAAQKELSYIHHHICMCMIGFNLRGAYSVGMLHHFQEQALFCGASWLKFKGLPNGGSAAYLLEL